MFRLYTSSLPWSTLFQQNNYWETPQHTYPFQLHNIWIRISIYVYFYFGTSYHALFRPLFHTPYFSRIIIGKTPQHTYPFQLHNTQIRISIYDESSTPQHTYPFKIHRSGNQYMFRLYASLPWSTLFQQNNYWETPQHTYPFQLHNIWIRISIYVYFYFGTSYHALFRPLFHTPYFSRIIIGKTPQHTYPFQLHNTQIRISIYVYF